MYPKVWFKPYITFKGLEFKNKPEKVLYLICMKNKANCCAKGSTHFVCALSTHDVPLGRAVLKSKSYNLIWRITEDFFAVLHYLLQHSYANNKIGKHRPVKNITGLMPVAQWTGSKIDRKWWATNRNADGKLRKPKAPRLSNKTNWDFSILLPRKLPTKHGDSPILLATVM